MEIIETQGVVSLATYPLFEPPSAPVKNTMELENYLRFMAGTIPIDFTDVLKHFAAFEQAFDKGGRQEVNKLFFSLDFKAGSIAPAPIDQAVFELLKEKMDIYQKNIFQTKARELERSIENTLQNIAEYHRRVDDHILKLRDFKQELEGVKLIGPKLDSVNLLWQIEELTKLGYTDLFWDNIANRISMITPKITLNYFNNQAGITQSVYMGKFRVSLRIDTFRVYVYGSDDAVAVDEYYHPHVSVDGGVCFGNAAHIIDSARTDRDLFTMFKTTLDILREYNDDNPFQALAKWWQLQNPDYIKTLPQVWSPYCVRISVALDDVDDWPSIRGADIEEASEDNDEGYQRYFVRTYRWEYQSTGLPAGENKFAVKSNNGRYVELSTLPRRDWEWE